jgi:hypothetical protein
MSMVLVAPAIHGAIWKMTLDLRGDSPPTAANAGSLHHNAGFFAKKSQITSVALILLEFLPTKNSGAWLLPPAQ